MIFSGRVSGMQYHMHWNYLAGVKRFQEEFLPNRAMAAEDYVAQIRQKRNGGIRYIIIP